MNETKRPTPVLGYQLEMLDGELLLFHPASMKILHSNQSGALIWQLCDGQRTVTDIVDLLGEAYPDSGSQIRADTYEALQIFADHGAIEWK